MQSLYSPSALTDGRGFLTVLRGYLATNLERLLRDRSWSQRTLATKLGVTEAYVSKLMNRRGFPSEDMLERMGEILGVPPGSLVQEPGASALDPMFRLIQELAAARGYD